MPRRALAFVALAACARAKRTISDFNRLPVRVADAAFTSEDGVPATEAAFMKAVKWWLNEGGHVDARCPSKYGATMLLIAVSAGFRKVTTLLLRYDANVNLAEATGWTPLMVGAQSQDIDMRTLQALLDKGADVNAQIEDQPHLNRIPEAAGGWSAQTRDMRGYTALHIAARSGRVDIIRALLDAGANDDIADHKGRQPIHIAASQNVKEAIMERGLCKVTGQLDACAAEEGLSALTPQSKLWGTPCPRATALIKKWVRDGHDIDTRCMTDGEGWTLLISCAMHGKLELVKWLIRHGANVNLPTTKRQETALHASVDGACHREIIQVLIAAGADVNAHNRIGSTALIAAAYDGDHSCVLDLLLAGADRSMVDATSRTAADRAREAGHEKLADLIENFDSTGRAATSRGAWSHSHTEEEEELFRVDLSHVGITLVVGIVGWAALRWELERRRQKELKAAKAERARKKEEERMAKAEAKAEAKREAEAEAKRKAEELERNKEKELKAKVERARKTQEEQKAKAAKAKAKRDAEARAKREEEAKSEAEAKAKQDAAKCVVCLVTPKTHLLQPCGHYCICSGCLEEMKGFVASRRICPMCRSPFQSSQRVYDTG